jgi:hypothetical protein
LQRVKTHSVNTLFNILRDAGDIVDRLCIAQLKAERIGTPETRKEFRDYFEGLFTHILMFPDVRWWKILNELYIIHQEIWNLESDIRQSKLDNDIAEVGRRAIIIRDWNKKRVVLKNYINTLLGEGNIDVKKSHASE